MLGAPYTLLGGRRALARSPRGRSLSPVGAAAGRAMGEKFPRGMGKRCRSRSGFLQHGKWRRETPGGAGRGVAAFGVQPPAVPHLAGCCAPPSGCPRPRHRRCRGAAEPEGCVGSCWQRGRPCCGQADPRESEGRQGSQPRSGVFLGTEHAPGELPAAPSTGSRSRRRAAASACSSVPGRGTEQPRRKVGSTQRCWWVSPSRAGRQEDRGWGALWAAREV